MGPLAQCEGTLRGQLYKQQLVLPWGELFGEDSYEGITKLKETLLCDEMIDTLYQCEKSWS